MEIVGISAKLLELAAAKAEEAGVAIGGLHLGSATDLSRFPADSRDAVLCMGPMYHLIEPADRDLALRECLRILRPGGLVFVAFVSVLGRVFDLVRNYPENLLDNVPRIADLVNGPSIASSDEARFTDAYFVQPEDVAPLMQTYPVEQLALLGVEGLTAQSEAVITGVNRSVTHAWIELAIRTAASPAALYGSDHLLFVGRKR